jgi:histidyl-tRNA synthetase
MLDYLCDDCLKHFGCVKDCLDAAEIEYEIDTRIVRGLDYYTRTVFEFVSDALGAQAVVCGGGRYDGLIEELGGPHLPSLGFGMGLERLLMVLEAKGAKFPEPPRCDVYFASMGYEAMKRCFKISARLREGGVSAECDTVGRGLKAQMKYADKIGARYTIVVGDNELQTGSARLKDMKTGEESEIELDDSLYTALYNKSIDRQLAGMAEIFSATAEV